MGLFSATKMSELEVRFMNAKDSAEKAIESDSKKPEAWSGRFYDAWSLLHDKICAGTDLPALTKRVAGLEKVKSWSSFVSWEGSKSGSGSVSSTRYAEMEERRVELDRLRDEREDARLEAQEKRELEREEREIEREERKAQREIEAEERKFQAEIRKQERLDAAEDRRIAREEREQERREREQERKELAAERAKERAALRKSTELPSDEEIEKAQQELNMIRALKKKQ